MTGSDSLSDPAAAVLAALLALVLAVGVVAAVPVGVTVDTPETAAPGSEIEVTYEITNEGEDPTSALGLNATVPDGLTVTAIETATGSAAERRNSVFWIEPVDPGATVSATFVIEVDTGANGVHTIDAEVISLSDNDTSELVSTGIEIDPDAGGSADDGTTTAGDSPGTTTVESGGGAGDTTTVGDGTGGDSTGTTGRPRDRTETTTETDAGDGETPDSTTVGTDAGTATDRPTDGDAGDSGAGDSTGSFGAQLPIPLPVAAAGAVVALLVVIGGLWLLRR